MGLGYMYFLVSVGAAFYVKEYDPGLLLAITRALYGFARL